MKRGFTLIEILFVLVLISVLMLMIFRFGSDRLWFFSAQVDRDISIWYVKDMIQRNMSTSFIGTGHYENMIISFSSGSSVIGVKYMLWNHVIYEEESRDLSSAYWLIRDGDNYLVGLDLVYSPYKLACDIGYNGLSYEKIMLELNSSLYKYCWEMKSDNCMMARKDCYE